MLEFNGGLSNYVVGPNVGRMYSVCVEVYSDELRAKGMELDDVILAVDEFKETLRKSTRAELETWYEMSKPATKSKPRKSRLNANKF